MSGSAYQIDDDPFILGHAGQSLRYALSQGALVHVAEAPSGKGNGALRCPECGETLLARKGTMRTHHFAHLSSAAADGCGIESAAHLRAKDIIINAGWVNGQSIADYWSFDEFPLEGGWKVDLFPWGKITFTSADPEVSAGSRRVDVMAYGAMGWNNTPVGPKMAVEICASHRVDDDKLSDLEDLGIPTLEIFLDPRIPVRESDFQDHVLRGARRSWKVPPPTDNQRKQVEERYQERLEQLRAERERQSAINNAIIKFKDRADAAGENALILFGPEAAGRLEDATLVALTDLPGDLDSEDVIEEHFTAKSGTPEFQTCAPDWDVRGEFTNVWGYLLCARFIGEGRLADKSQRSAALFEDIRKELGELGVHITSLDNLGYDLSSQSDWSRFFELDPVLAQGHSSVLVRALIGLNTYEALGEPDHPHYIRQVPTWLEPTGLKLAISTGLSREKMSRKEIGVFMEGQHLSKCILQDKIVQDACQMLLARLWRKGSDLPAQLNLSKEEGIGPQCIMMVQRLFKLDEGLFPPRSRDLILNKLRSTWRAAATESAI